MQYALPIANGMLSSWSSGSQGESGREVHSLDPNLAAYNVTTLQAQIDRTIASDRLLATLTALLGILALLVATVGMYCVVAFAVAARTREIGIRMALGATHGGVLALILRESAALIAIGIAVGVPGALLLWIPARRAATVDPATTLRYD